MIRRYFKPGQPTLADAKGLGELKPVEPAARRAGVPLLGDGQVYVMKRGTDYHTRWCQAVADNWGQAPRGLLVTMLADIGGRTECKECARPLKAATTSSARDDQMQSGPGPEPPLPNAVIPLKVIGVAHGVLVLAAGPEYREQLRATAVEPATPLYVDGRRDGIVARLDVGRPEPLLVVRLDPRATFRSGPYQVHLRRPLQRSATKPFAVAYVEPAPPA